MVVEPGLAPLLRAAAVLLCVTAAGCAQVVTGTVQRISVSSTPELGAKCLVRSERGTWDVPSTPGIVVVARASTELAIDCSHPDGTVGKTIVNAEGNPAILGNALAGGVVGLISDTVSGAAYQYPSEITVTLVRPASAALGAMPPRPAASPDAQPAVENAQPVQLAAATPISRAAPAGSWTSLGPGARLILNNGPVDIEGVDDESVYTVNARGGRGRWYRGLIFLQNSSPRAAITSGQLWPLEVGRTATLSERTNWTGAAIAHEIKVMGIEDITINQRTYRVFRITEQVRESPPRRGGDVVRHYWYSPEIGFSLRYLSEDIGGGPVQANWRVVRIEQAKGHSPARAETPTPARAVQPASVPATPASLRMAAIDMGAPAGPWTPLTAGAQLLTRQGGRFVIEAVDEDTLYTKNVKGFVGRWYRGLVLLDGKSQQVSLTSGQLWPLEVGRSATLREQTASSTIAHEIQVVASEEITLNQRSHRVFHVTDQPRETPPRQGGDFVRHYWYAPEFGFVLGYRTVESGSGRVLIDWQAMRIDTAGATQ
jgi:hypothetical protein